MELITVTTNQRQSWMGVKPRSPLVYCVECIWAGPKNRLQEGIAYLAKVGPKKNDLYYSYCERRFCDTPAVQSGKNGIPGCEMN